MLNGVHQQSNETCFRFVTEHSWFGKNDFLIETSKMTSRGQREIWVCRDNSKPNILESATQEGISIISDLFLNDGVSNFRFQLLSGSCLI